MILAASASVKRAAARHVRLLRPGAPASSPPGRVIAARASRPPDAFGLSSRHARRARIRFRHVHAERRGANGVGCVEGFDKDLFARLEFGRMQNELSARRAPRGSAVGIFSFAKTGGGHKRAKVCLTNVSVTTG